ncbi:Protein O-mannosyl-transferase 1 [Homalodisca vitripennis]|nr:Protein O-mannosyl-transferase 1 [Homalodisca vitripennis]
MEVELKSKKMKNLLRNGKKKNFKQNITLTSTEQDFTENPSDNINEHANTTENNLDMKKSKTDIYRDKQVDGTVMESSAFIKSVKPGVNRFQINIELDAVAAILFIAAIATRFYKLEQPRHIVFDELHYGKYVSLYMKRTFYFDSHPPFGKQLIAAVAYLAGFDGNFRFERIGSQYSSQVPLFALRLIPALCGSLLVPAAYYLILELGCSQWAAGLAAFLLLADNALLTQSRFVLMESQLLLFSVVGLLCVLRFRRAQTVCNHYSLRRWAWLLMAFVCLTLSLCVKYVGFYSWCLGIALVCRDYWRLLADRAVSDISALYHAVLRSAVIVVASLAVYLAVFYIHLAVLNKAGPHDSVMTSAFQANLEGGLASITRGQPLEVGHGSQVTLRHTHGRACWLHSHPHVYPIRYPDQRGSSHQQQVTCYTFKDVNNWWIVKRPNKDNLVVSQPVDVIKHDDVVQLVHGITSRALNSHDVAAAMSPHNQEVSCYIDYNVSMPAQNLWRVDIVNREQEGDVWHTIQSQVRLIHVNSSQALKFSGRQLPDWGFNQHEVVTDRVVHQEDTVWNVEEHRYTKSEDEKERERDLVNAEMIPLQATRLSWWRKLSELQYKMLITHQENVQNHMYSSEPLEWPLMTRGIAYWVSTEHNGQVHLLGNLVIWYSGTAGLLAYCSLLVFYLLRRRRQCYDLPEEEWHRFIQIGEVLLCGFLFHYLPFFFVERTLFLHHYLPAFVFKVLLLAALAEHMLFVIWRWPLARLVFYCVVLCFVFAVLHVFRKFCVLSYGTSALSANDVMKLRWKDSWDFIVHM